MIDPAFLGPNGEHAAAVEALLVQAFRDHVRWRREAFPGDVSDAAPLVDLQERLRGLTDRLRRDAPTFHPRHLGHMSADVLVAGVVGQLAAMFHSPNALDSVATTELEAEAIAQLAAMLGYPADHRGHLGSGGTVANLEALWTVRNLRHLPVSLALALRDSRRDLEVDGRSLRSRSTLELLNLPLSTILALTESVDADWLTRFGPERIGVGETDRLLTRAGLRPLSDHPWRIVTSAARHHSVDKAADLLGLGRDAVRPIPLTDDLSIDVPRLEAALDDGVPLAVVAVMGSTDSGAVDDLPAILEVRRRWRSRGGEFWLHADAAYGGYALAMTRGNATLPAFLSTLAGRNLMDDPLVAGWSRSLERLAGVADADSITIDPHKMGWLPYPAGAILFRDPRSLRSSNDVAYLPDGSPGRWTLEGSRPGSVAAGVHLAQSTMPLDQSGHGVLVGRSFLAAGDLYANLPREIVRFVVPPAMNVLNYIPTRGATTLSGQNALTERVARTLAGFTVATTSLDLSTHPLDAWLRDAGLVRDAERLTVIRSAVMHTASVDTADGPLWNAFARALG